MKSIIFILFFLFFASCENSSNVKLGDTLTAVSCKDEIEIKFSEQELESFLDSVGKLDTKTLMDKVSFDSDSIFNSQLQIDKTISIIDFNNLKKAIKAKKIDVKMAKKIFGVINIDSSFIETGIIPLNLYSFDKVKKELNEFAICLGHPNLNSGCELYFFKSNQLISKHNIYHRYGLELNHYKDLDGKTIIYYKENYQSGSGIWWFNFYFYKYYNNKLIPVLNELENGNLQYPWGLRVLWLESTIQKTNPLTIKMKYYQQLSDTINPDSIPNIINDSAIVTYTWDENTKTLNGNYVDTEISKSQIMTYYLEDNELLFINAYYKILKKTLLNKTRKHLTFNYLNTVKNYYDNK